MQCYTEDRSSSPCTSMEQCPRYIPLLQSSVYGILCGGKKMAKCYKAYDMCLYMHRLFLEGYTTNVNSGH